MRTLVRGATLPLQLWQGDTAERSHLRGGLNYGERRLGEAVVGLNHLVAKEALRPFGKPML